MTQFFFTQRPRNFGLKFAACSSDGIVRVYEASDPLNLGPWEVEDFAAGDKGGACSALSWCTGSDGERIGVVGESGLTHYHSSLGC